MAKFDTFEALKANGFNEEKGAFGSIILRKEYSKEVEVAWQGTWTSRLTVELQFNPEKSVIGAAYYDGGRSPFKTKTHLNDKRAYNAIKQTVENKGFAL